MATIKEIAREAGVSIATVSYVLNGTAKISPETEMRVRQAVEKLGYKPNSIAQSLKRRRSNSIGIITEDITVFNSPDIFDGINEYATEHSFHIILNNFRLQRRYGGEYLNIGRYSGDIAEIVSDFLSKQVEGIIYIGSHVRDVSGLMPDRVGVPLVYTYCYAKRPDSVSICYDDVAAAREVGRYLLGMGHRNLGVICGKPDSLQTQYRLEGFKRALDEAGVALDDRFVHYSNWERAGGYDIAVRILEAENHPTAIFAMNDLMAIGAMDAASERGLSVPDDISVFGFDARECSEYYHPRLSTVSLPLRDMGRRAAAELIGMIGGQKPSDRMITLTCELVERESVKKLS